MTTIDTVANADTQAFQKSDFPFVENVTFFLVVSTISLYITLTRLHNAT